MTASVLIICGEGPDTDRWHDFPATSAAVAGALGALGSTRVRGSRSVAAEDFDGVRLVVVNVSGEGSGPAEAAVSLIDDANRAGVAVLGVHSAVIGFPGDARWAELIGGRWVRGTTFHPPIGEALIRLDATHPAMLGAPDFVVYDERYSAIATGDGNRRVAFHTEDGVVHDLAWTRERPGRGRVAYWGLGHGVESLAGAEHRERLVKLASWLVGSAPASLDRPGHHA
jgi:type 1 glutamine amidotransferase